MMLCSVRVAFYYY